jgi:NOL1/NOP2/fmu family ribosome biogenesis protein
MTPNESGGNAENTADETRENVSDRFDRLPATADDRAVTGRPTREAVLSWWAERFGIDSAVFELYSFWERGAGKIWAFHGKLASPVDADGLGMMALRTRQEHWKPTLEAAQRFGGHATRNCIHLPRPEAATFLAGEDQELDWEGDWGYLIVTHELAGETEPLGVGLYVYGELRSMVPKGRRRDPR